MADRRLRFTGPGIWYRSTVAQRELPQQEARHVFRAIARGLQAHGRAVAAMRELAFERAPQVVDFFLVDEQVAVARDAELIAAEHFDAREQLVHERVHDGREQHERAGGAARGWRGHDARQRARRLHDGELAVAAERILAAAAAR